MSDANDLDKTNSISVDENVFETFENSVVGEESEFITLSDILADEVKQPTEMPGEFDDFLYENDEASQEFQTHLNDVVNNQLADAVSESHNYNNTVLSHEPPAGAATKHAQKRTRRSRKTPKDVNSEYNELESTDLGSTRRSKRERKPRVIPDSVIPPVKQDYLEVLTKAPQKSNQESKHRKKSKVISDSVISHDYPQENSEDVTTTKEDTCLANGSVHVPTNKKKKGRKPKQISAEIQKSSIGNDLDTDQEGDNICLSKIKAQLSSSIHENQNKPILSDFEYDIENVITQTSNVVVESIDTAYKPLQLKDNLDNEPLDNNIVPKCEDILNSTDTCSNDNQGPLNSDSLLVEDTSKRPVRKKARRNTKYQFDSDEDLFANVELSEEDRPKRRKKSNKYYSDDEYIPGGEVKQASSEEENDIDELDSDYDENRLSVSKKRKCLRKKTDGFVQNRTPKKIPKILPEVTTLPPAEGSDDFEQMLESSVIKSDPSLIKTINACTPNQEFENFLATRIPGNNLLVKKVSLLDKPALEIPSINPKELPKLVERGSQTKAKETKIACVQTSSPYAIKMVNNINFTVEQSEKACDFLKNILSTTSELGKLMTEKSEEFMQKKINTTHVKDTTKMDYCVKKAFLLFKLAKDNLSTMEETLEKQYEEFLRNNNFGSAIVTDRKITPKQALKDDSDCEIIDDPLPAKPTVSKPNSAAKTVFLNKELSIKIAKKAPTTTTTTAAASSSNIPNKSGKNLNVQGKNEVWLNSAVMVKKAKPTNHFLAQDGRNKKPPDSVTNKMVKDFFDWYSRRNASLICAQFTSPQWLHVQPPEVTCNYFVVATLGNESSSTTLLQPLEPFVREPEQTNGGISTPNSIDENIYMLAGDMPQSLVSLCTKACNKIFKLRSNGLTLHHKDVTTLSNLCLNKITSNLMKTNSSLSIINLEEAVEDPTTDDDLVTSLDESSLDEVVEIPALKTLCFNVVSQYFSAPTVEVSSMVTIAGTYNWNFPGEVSNGDSCFSLDSKRSPGCFSPDQEIETHTFNVKSLQSIVYQYVLHVIYGNSLPAIEKDLLIEDYRFGVKTLFKICFQLVSRYINPEPQISEILPFNGLTIDTINTMSDEAFHDLGANDNYDQYTADDDYLNEEDYNNAEESQNEQAEENWMTKAKLKELRLGIISGIFENTDTGDVFESQSAEPLITRIKSEIPDEIPEDPIQLVNLKTEPEEHNEMVSIPDDIVTKAEHQDYIENGQTHAAMLTNVDAEGFESFIRGNKMMQGVSSYLEDRDTHSIFSQSAYRVRRQHAPDSDTENDYDMDLLVPHDSEVFDMAKTKGNLMNSSSSDDEKNKSDKKGDKKKKGKTKKQPEPKQTKTIEVTKKNLGKEKAKPQPEPENEVAILTRRMREKIRTEEKKDESDSDSELNLNKTKNNKDKNENTTSKSDLNSSENEIQCNSVDSTAVITDKKNEVIKGTRKSARKKDADVEDTFTGFNNDDLTEIEKYKKQLDDVYDKILNEDMCPEEVAAVEEASNGSDRFSPPLMADEPAEILECAPTMPIFEPKKTRKNKSKPIEKAAISETETAEETVTENKISIDKEKKKQSPILERPFVEKDGWKCYQMDINDTKLNQVAYIGLEKLPEAFVQTYFQYQEINCISKEDVEVDRLTNLQSLHRSGKETKHKGKGKLERSSNLSVATAADVTPIGLDAENFEELIPSDDEGNLHDNENLPPLPLKHTENTMAKTILMDEEQSASDGEGGRIKVKKEHPDPDDISLSKRKSAKNVKVVDHPKNLVLTADKMMKKELDMLHAPVNLDEDLKYSPPDSKPKKHSSKSHTKRERRKSRGDDSSSEEEKLWVNTKSKLLKRMEKKVQEDTTVDDAKRAKIVSEFIERRTDSGLVRVGAKKRLTRVSRKKMLEREKQMWVLSKEFTEGQVVGKGSSVSYSKGRKNIRKVLDKKSLARSTVTANMEEFARKRRLHMKQNRLRELLGYEEDVNVLVINDEVCLEYDFKELQPVVTIHPFFTRVMKAHQYEGVKFMWDACFESLEVIASGHPGAGCILAHCMGLGKTLQVLALLHTVLMHPKVGMHRVLVCCPLSTVLNWVDEIHKWLGPVTNQIKVFELSKLRKTYERAYQLEDWYTGGGIFIVGYELFRSLTTLDPEYDDIRPTIVQKIRMALLDPGPDIVVCDEGHLLKNDSSVLALAMSRVKTKRRIVLTGTPMQNNLREYFCMVNFIKPNLLGTYSEYSNRFENPIMNGQHRDSREEDIRLMKARTHILHKVLEGCLQRQEASVLYPYLPTKHEYTVFIKLSEAQTDLYKHYLHNYAKSNRLNNKNNILKDFHVLQKIWSHPHVLHSFLSRVRDDKVKQVKEERIEDDLAREELAASEDVKPIDAETGWWLEYLDNGKLLDELEASTKFQVVFNILKECVALDDKLLIFSTSLYTMDSLEYFLKKINNWSLGQEYYRLDGTVPPEVRHKWCREFNSEKNHKTKLFLISTRAGSLGLNMTAANRVIILDTSWNPAHDIQSIFRIYRFGQRKDCFIYRLVAMGTMEQKIYERSVTKQAVACRVVDEQQIDRHYNMADLAELYDFSESGWGISCGVAGAVRDVVLLRAARLACLHAAHEHDSLLRAARDQDLPEHERAAAWSQFQLEHEHTKEQTGMALALSVFGPQQATIPNDFGINIPPLPKIDPVITDPTDNIIALTPTPTSTGKEKGKKGKKVKPEINEPPECSFAVTSKQNTPDFNQPGITIVPPKGMKDPNNVLDRIREILKNTDFRNADGVIDAAEITKVISSLVSSEKITVAPPETKIKPTITVDPPQNDQPKTDNPEPNDKRKRGRPKKETLKTQQAAPNAKKQPEMPNAVDDANPNISRDGRYKRRAAVVAERNLESVSRDDDLTISSDDDYQPDDNDGSQDSDFAVPEKEKPSKVANQNSQEESILLSDDDDVGSGNLTKTTSNDSAVIPMHRSLLKNKNFIKIVAHTYLKGNPMLDEDAAMLAAEYSTNKALKEVEITGKDIDSGPIYDIASQVLGLDVLKKLMEKDSNKTAAAEKVMKSYQQTPIKQEASNAASTQTKPAEKPKIRIKTEKEMRLPAPAVVQNNPTRRKAQIQCRKIFEDNDIGADMNEGFIIPMGNQPAPKEPPPELTKYKPGPSSAKAAMARKSMAAQLQESAKLQGGPTQFDPKQLPALSSSGGVVPIGMFKRTETLGLTMPIVDEECILPDDDDVRISVEPQIRPSPQSLLSNITPVIIKSNLSQPSLEITPLTRRITSEQNATSDYAPIVTAGSKTMQLKRLTTLPDILAKKQKLAIMVSQQQNLAAASSATISLDSDDEEPTPPAAPIITTKPIPAPKANMNGSPCIVIPASAFQEILKRVKSISAAPNIQSTVLSNPAVTPSTSKSQIKTGDKLFMPSGPALKPRAAKATTAAKASPISATPAKVTLAPKPEARAKTPPKPAAPKQYPDIAISSSSESERSRSPSPIDPMAILRNVVHIQADPAPAAPKPKYNVEPEPKLSKIVPKPSPAVHSKPSPAVHSKPSPAVHSKPSPAVPSHSKATRSQSSKPTPPKQPQLIHKTDGLNLKLSENAKIKRLPYETFKMTQSLKSTVQPSKTTAPPYKTPAQPSKTTAPPAKTTAQPSKTTAPPAKTTAQSSKTTAPPAKTTAQPPKTSQQTKTGKNTKDDNYRLLGSFDLTDLPEVSVLKTTSADKPGTSAKSANVRKTQEAKSITISGKSRDIILTPGNKSVVKALPNDSSVMEKSNAAKRKSDPAPVIQSAAKRKKPTRLEDFSLDDLEDIIELE